MKSINITAILLLGCALVSNAQTKQDHATSVDNYKHPNKAAQARKLNLDKRATLIVIDSKSTGNPLNSKANYKGSFLTTSDGGALITKENEILEGSPNLSKGNYKAQSNNISTTEKK